MHFTLYAGMHFWRVVRDMPYVCVDSNRYIGEHSCGRYHYGDMAMIRECCVEDCRKYAELTLKNATTTAHPAYRLYIAAWNSLTDAEQALVPNIRLPL